MRLVALAWALVWLALAAPAVRAIENQAAPAASVPVATESAVVPPPPPPQGSGGVSLNLPAFDYTADFVTPTEGGVLRAEEVGWIRIELRNLEQREFKQIRVAYKALTPLDGLSPSGSLVLDQIGPAEKRTIELPIASGRSMPSGVVDYVIEVTSVGGAYGPPARITFRTRAFVPPRLEILAVDRTRLGERLLVKAQIHNLGGTARDVSARFVSTEPGVSLESTASLPIGDLGSGQIREVFAEVALDPESLGRLDVPIWLEISERHSDLAVREQLTIPLGENETLTNSATASTP